MKRIVKPVSFILSLLLVLSSIQVYAAPRSKVIRLYGDNRFQTAVSISQQGWKNSNTVILCTGEGDDKFADALAGAPLAKALDAPILLTNTDLLNSDTNNEIIRLNAKKAIILGGAGVISNTVENQLIRMGVMVERLWGQDRYATAVKIAEKLYSLTNSKKAILTTGYEFQYALIAAPFADGMPILFTENDKLPQVTIDILKSVGISSIEIIGNTKVVSAAVQNNIESMKITVERIDGTTIHEVNMNMVKKHYPNPTNVALARDDIFADALAGAAFAIKNLIPIFVVNPSSITPNIKIYLSTFNTSDNYIFGGPGAISDNIVKEYFSNLTSSSITLKPPFKKKPDTGTPIVKIPGDASKPFNSTASHGNTSGNINNLGFASIHGNEVYFRLIDGLAKSDIDGSNFVKLSDDKASNINVVNSWIYYTNWSDNFQIYKMKTDGTMREKISNDSSDYMTVVGDWIVYKNTSEWKLYKIRTDGAERIKICEDNGSNLNIVGDWIYYILGNGPGRVCRIKINGTGREELGINNASSLNIIGDWIYYSDSNNFNQLFKARITSPQIATKLADRGVNSINVHENWVYYTLSDSASPIWKMTIDGTSPNKINNDSSGFFSIVGNYIFYTNFTQDFKTYRMSLDGSQQQSTGPQPN